MVTLADSFPTTAREATGGNEQRLDSGQYWDWSEDSSDSESESESDESESDESESDVYESDADDGDEMSDSQHTSIVRRVRWSDSDTVVHEIERLSIAQVVGCGWVQTRDLCNREFWQPQTEGGCGGQWAMLMKFVDQIDEPDYCAVGNIWAAICERNRPGSSNMLRPEERKLQCEEQQFEEQQAMLHKCILAQSRSRGSISAYKSERLPPCAWAVFSCKQLQLHSQKQQKLLLKAVCNPATKPVSHVRHRRSHVDVKANSRSGANFRALKTLSAKELRRKAAHHPPWQRASNRTALR